MSDTIVEVRDLRKTYNAWSLRGQKRINALRGVSLSAEAGEVFGLLGPNGAGKTTLIKILLGVIKPSSGNTHLFGQPLTTSIRSRIGYLPESLRVDRHHTARSALRYYGLISRMTPGQIARRSDELLELVGLRGRDRESVRQFSKGMYQRLGLAQALLHDPDLLVLDEPTDGLDPVGRSEVRKVIERMRDAGKTIFLNSHILQEVELVCTRVAIMAGGRIRGMGKISDLSGQDDANRIHLVLPLTDSETAEPDLKQRLIELLHFSDHPEEPLEFLLDPDKDSVNIQLRLDQQSQIDQVVDRLRGNGFSISHLQVYQPSLEDTFMRLVQQAEQEEADATAELDPAHPTAETTGATA